ncbi:Uncharacterised protein [Klebsiella pneumoniae]|nr:Uncharacterised protein [Klebsiella pneumoniae]
MRYPPNVSFRESQALRRSIPCFFNHTSKIEIAAGVMPEIRDACPIEDGLWSFNLAMTSFDSPFTWR